MHILAFNSSPRDNQTSKTELVLQKFLEGARRAGAETETLYLRNYQIKHCLGCFSCWTKTPGRCVQKDDMAEAALRALPSGRPGGPGHAPVPLQYERPDEDVHRAHPAHGRAGRLPGSERRPLPV